MPVTVTLPSTEEVDDVYNPSPRMVYDPEQLGPAGNVQRVVMGCIEGVAEPRPVRKQAETRQEQREADAAELAARQAESVRENREYMAAREAEAKDPLPQPPVKAKRSRRNKAEMIAVRAAQYARADATPDDELHPALHDDPLPMLEFEMDDLAKEIQESVK